MNTLTEQTPDPSPRRPGFQAADWLLLMVLAAVQFTHIVDFVILMPLGERYQTELHMTPQQFGFLVAAYAFSAAIGGLFASVFIDRFDRKHALLTLYCGFTLGTIFCALAGDFVTLLLARCVTGAFGGVGATCTLAIVGDAFPEERRGLAMGVVMSAFSVSTIIGVPAGLMLAASLGRSAPFAFLAGLSGVVLAVAVLALPPLRHHFDRSDGTRKVSEPVRKGVRPPETPKGSDPFSHRLSTWKILTTPSHLRAYALAVALVLGNFTVIPFIASYLTANLGWRESYLAWMYFFGGSATLLTTAWFGRLADRFGKLRVFRILALCSLVPMVALTNLPPTPFLVGLLVSIVFMVVTSGRMVPAMALITSSAAPANRGSFMSVIGSVQQMGMGLAALVAGIVVRRPIENGPLENFPLVGLLACATTLLSVYLAGFVHALATTALAESVKTPLDQIAEAVEPIAGVPRAAEGIP